jgi:hypothetical protein
MASVANKIIENFQDLDLENQFVNTGLTSGSPDYRINLKNKIISTYGQKDTLDTNSEIIQEKIAFLIDCYTTFYDKLGNVEERLGIIEKQNSEILLFLSKEQNAVMVSSAECFAEISSEQMKATIIEYYRSHPVVYPSDIANEMNFDLRDVVKIIKELIASGQVEEVP